MYLTERDTADTLVYWRNFFGPNMVFAFAVFSLLAGLLTFGYWLTSKGKRDNSLLYYSLFAVGFVLSFIHYLLGFDSAPSLVLEKVRVLATPLWFLAFALYLLHRLGKARVWRTPLILMALVYVPFDLAIVGMASPSAVLLASGPVYGVLVVETLLVLIALIGFAVRRRDANSLAMVVFQLLAQASFAFDVGYYLVVGYHPWFLTSPYITMFLLVHQLVLLGRDLRRSQHAAEEKSVALERLNQSLHAEVDRRNLDLNSFVSILSYDLKNMLFGLRQLTEGLASQANPEPAAFGQLAVAAHRTEEVLASLLRLSASRTATLQPERRSLSVSALWGPAPGGGVRCETRLEADATVLSVEDDGPGVPADQRRHVFSLQKPGVPGAGFTERGFGLALCAELAERLGHRLVLASTDSRARFELILEAPGGLTP